MTRTHSTSAVDSFERAVSSRSGSRAGSSDKVVTQSSLGDEAYVPDLRWQVRLQELEYKLKAEREARTLDRKNAMRRLEEKSRENAELVAEVERNRVRGQMGRS